jgi:hypothetical protein
MRDTFTGAAAPRAVILAPPRELCSQIYNEAIKFCHRSPFRVLQIYGGVDAKAQLIHLPFKIFNSENERKFLTSILRNKGLLK